MKIKIISIFCLFFILALHTQNLPLQAKKESAECVTPINKEVREKQLLVIPYSQFLLIFPGVGIAVRVPYQRFAAQFDANITYVNLGYFGSNTHFQSSLAMVYYPFYNKNSSSSPNGWNVTCGLGMIGKLGNETKFMWGPVSIGYQGEKLFLDVGISASDLVLVGRDRSNNNKPFLFSYPRFFGPILKFGICF